MSTSLRAEQAPRQGLLKRHSCALPGSGILGDFLLRVCTPPQCRTILGCGFSRVWCPTLCCLGRSVLAEEACTETALYPGCVLIAGRPSRTIRRACVSPASGGPLISQKASPSLGSSIGARDANDISTPQPSVSQHS